MEVIKRIWLVNYYAMPPELESRFRTIKFAQYLSENGYDVTIIGASYMHNMNLNLIDNNAKYITRSYNKLSFIHIRTISYSKSGIYRIVSLFQFHVKLLKLSSSFQKPDLIIHTALPPFGNVLYFLAKSLKIKYFVEVLDLWPESFVDIGLISKKNPLLPFLYASEKWLYQKADKIIFSIEGGKDYVINKKWDKQFNKGPIDLEKIHYINNGIDLKDFYIYMNKYKLNDLDLENNSIKRVIYIGSIRLANNLMKLIKAAELLSEYNNIKFLIYGDGEERIILEKYCTDKKLTNIIFKEKRIDPKYVPYLLSKSHVNILNYFSDTFGKYGGSQSKLFQYMASGKPICSNIQMLYCPIRKHSLGIAKKFNSDKEYADSILELLFLNDNKRNSISNRMKIIVKEYDYSTLTKKLITLWE